MDNIYHLLVKFGELRHNCVFYTSSSRGEVSKVCMHYRNTESAGQFI